MSTAKLKIDLINRITKLKEPRIIEELQRILDFELERSAFKLNNLQKERLAEAKDDDALTEEQANQEIEEWLKEK